MHEAQAQDSEKCAAPLRLLERSVFSDRMVFVRAVHEAKWLSPMELSIYDSWCWVLFPCPACALATAWVDLFLCQTPSRALCILQGCLSCLPYNVMLVSNLMMPLSRFDPVVSSLKGLVPDGFIYLHATPETCMRRMASRCAARAFYLMGCTPNMPENILLQPL